MRLFPTTSSWGTRHRAWGNTKGVGLIYRGSKVSQQFQSLTLDDASGPGADRPAVPLFPVFPTKNAISCIVNGTAHPRSLEEDRCSNPPEEGEAGGGLLRRLLSLQGLNRFAEILFNS